MNDELKKEILEVLKRFNVCVISTVSEGPKPEAAIVGFSCNDKLELVVGTSNHSRKFANLMKNPQVALAIGDNNAEVQYEGVVSQLDVEVSSEWLEAHIKQTPAAKFYVNDPNQVWFRITPSWIKLSVHGPENRIEEMSFA
jgi:general stress protein 26